MGARTCFGVGDSGFDESTVESYSEERNREVFWKGVKADAMYSLILL